VYAELYYENEFGQLYQGDCLEIMPELSKQMGDNKTALVLTDPPYFKRL
jgi:DNA modification methylase